MWKLIGWILIIAFVVWLLTNPIFWAVIIVAAIIWVTLKIHHKSSNKSNKKLINSETSTSSAKPKQEQFKPKVNNTKNTVSKIPQEIQDLLWFSDGGFGQHIGSNLEEPSAISILLPIEKGTPEELGYWPSYSDMTPKQRFTYLSWLTNIDQEIPFGYVFTFFYGLERHIFNGNVQPAIKMINRLKKFHQKSGSFNAYSNNAIAYAALKTQNPSLLEYIDKKSADSSLLFLTAGYLNHRVTAKEIINCSKEIGWTNTRYIKMYPEKFESNLEKILLKNFGYDYFPLDNQISIKDCPVVKLMLSNVSLDREESSDHDHIYKDNETIDIVFSYISHSPIIISVPDFSQATGVKGPLLGALMETHELTKKQLAYQRKEKRLS